MVPNLHKNINALECSGHIFGSGGLNVERAALSRGGEGREVRRRTVEDNQLDLAGSVLGPEGLGQLSAKKAGGSEEGDSRSHCKSVCRCGGWLRRTREK